MSVKQRFTTRATKSGLLLFLLLISTSPTGRSETSEYKLESLTSVLLNDQHLPTLQLKGRFEFFSAYGKEDIQLTSSATFVGKIDFTTRKVQFAFIDYRIPVVDGDKPYRISDYRITFDGEKWVHTEIPHKDPSSPREFESYTKITAEKPKMFLDSLDPFLFPLFAVLSDVMFVDKRTPFPRYISEPSIVTGAEVDVRREDSILKVIVTSTCIRDEFWFDPERNYAMTRRITDFSLCHTGDPMYKLKNETIVSEFFEQPFQWIPKGGRFVQYRGETVMVKRRFWIDDVAVAKDERFEAVIPPGSYVFDERFDISFITSSEDPN